MADAEAGTQPVNIQIFMQPGGGEGEETATYEQPEVGAPSVQRPKSCLCQCGSQAGSGGGR